MEKIDKNKRIFVKTSSLMTFLAIGGMPRLAYSVDPVTGGIIAASLAAAVSGFLNWIGGEKRLEAEKRMKAAEIQHFWFTKVVGEQKISMELAYSMYLKSLATLGLVTRADEANTTLNLNNGLLQVNRGAFSGEINAGEALAGKWVAEQLGTIPVPVEPMGGVALSRQEDFKIRNKLENGGMDSSQLALMASRRFSAARTPINSQAHVEMISYVDKTKPYFNDRPQVNYIALPA
jgi:hypothetical protein